MNSAKSTNIFEDFCSTCLGFIDILDLCSEQEKPKPNTNTEVNPQSQFGKLKSELSQKGVELHINQNNQLDITEKSDKNHKAFTKYLIEFIANEYQDDKDLIKQLNSLPEAGSREQDKKLIELAYQLARYKDDPRNPSEIYLEYPRDQIKEDIKILCEKNNKQNTPEHFIREFEDFTTGIVSLISAPFQLRSGKEDSKNGRN
jgi:hypothetical protein